MTQQERERMEAWIRANCGRHQYGEQDENGVDLSIIRENLRLTPQQRLRRGDGATTDLLRLREIVRKN
jgi:hypothetical protein